MILLTYHSHQYHTAQLVKIDLESKGHEVLLIEVEAQQDIQAFIQSLDIEENTLYILQKEDHNFFYDSELLKDVYYSWTDKTRLTWVQPSPYTEPLPW
jgi:hypothetical protein